MTTKLPRAPRTFGENLRAARVKAGITQTELAKRCGFKRQTPISLWEITPGYLPEPQTIEKLAAALAVTTASLMRDVVTPYDELRGAIRVAAAPAYSPSITQWIALGIALERRELLQSHTLLIEQTLRHVGETVPTLDGPGDARFRTRRPATPDATPPTEASATAREPRAPSRASSGEWRVTAEGQPPSRGRAKPRPRARD
jgi:transcriptional regulator with XRE-family HTH domain